MEKERCAVILPGSYDPVTLGHKDIIRRAAERYSEVWAVVFVNPDKTCSYTIDERVKMLILATEEFPNVIVSYSTGLVIDYMREHEIEKIVKGYRNEADLEYEKKMAEWNFSHGGYETEFIKCYDEFSDVSSTRARELIAEGANLEEILPKKVIEFIHSR